MIDVQIVNNKTVVLKVFVYNEITKILEIRIPKDDALKMATDITRLAVAEVENKKRSVIKVEALPGDVIYDNLKDMFQTHIKNNKPVVMLFNETRIIMINDEDLKGLHKVLALLTAIYKVPK